jgi:hypothetical protein
MSEFVSLFGLDPADDIVRAAVLAIPVAVLLTLLLILVVKSKAKRKRLKARIETGGAAPETFVSGHETVVPPASEPQASAVIHPAENPIEAVKTKLKEALSRDAKSSLAPLYLELARQQRAAGNEAECLSALRSAAGMAAQHGPRSAHAEARLELAEAAYKAGDLTGACEQWQIARTALHDDGQKEAHARIDKRMRDNGCPTDWVLTDF